MAELISSNQGRITFPSTDQGPLLWYRALLSPGVINPLASRGQKENNIFHKRCAICQFFSFDFNGKYNLGF